MSIDFTLRADGVAIITLNRPERHNALDAEHYAALAAAWERVRDDDDVRVAIVTGTGDKSFSTGGDIKTHLTRKTEPGDHWKTQREPMLNRGIELWKPVIAAVNGYCLGGGLNLMLATDIRIACETATFGVAEVKRGVLAGGGGTQRLIQQLPYPIAMELLMTGDPISAQEALRWGLVNKVVPKWFDVMPAALEYASRIAANAPLAVQASKELAIRSRDVPLGVGLRMEYLSLQTLFKTEDAIEGPAAFAEKRPPNFKGR